MLSTMELIFCVHYLRWSFRSTDQKSPTDTNVSGQSAGYAVSNMRSEVGPLIFFFPKSVMEFSTSLSADHVQVNVTASASAN